MAFCGGTQSEKLAECAMPLADTSLYAAPLMGLPKPVRMGGRFGTLNAAAAAELVESSGNGWCACLLEASDACENPSKPFPVLYACAYIVWQTLDCLVGRRWPADG